MSVDSMAEAIVEMRDSLYPVLHLAHPRPVSWSSVIVPISKALSLPLVPYSEWLERLQASRVEGNAESEVKSMQVNPALMLVDFFSHAMSAEAQEEEEAMGMRTLDMSRAVEVAPALSEQRLSKLGEKDAVAWVGYWRKIGFLSA